MEAWSKFLGETSSKPAKRSRADAVPDESAKVKELISVLTKLSLKTAQDVRMIMAVAFLCFKVGDEDGLYKAVKTEYKNHADRTRGKSGHNEGGPDGPALVALLVAIMQKVKLNDADTEIVTNFLNTVPPPGATAAPMALQKAVPCCKLQNAQRLFLQVVHQAPSQWQSRNCH